ncbi:MAG: transcription repressor NadR [Lachnospiraceae bacterium]|jgi:Predicted small molecule binding protein (contains 3H domain)|nr:transcription repressor NadR [Lachnospiraceae bacterium]
MEGEKRREEIISCLTKSTQPISGTELARNFHVSRQVIVQDIALLRATNKNILSTNRGYILYNPKNPPSGAKRILPVFHTSDRIREELYTIVDYGGKVLDVVVEHEVYGQITADLFLKNRGDVDDFMEKLLKNNSNPLNILTNGEHYHTIEAESEEILDMIEEKLSQRGFLVIIDKQPSQSPDKALLFE